MPSVVSIITIFRNEERFLQEAIDSVLAQTSGAWELLLIDDGSSDGSPDVARRNAERQPERIRYLTHPKRSHRGKCVSRNLGLSEARGDFVTFMDGDDVFLPDRIERHAAILTRETVAMVYGPTLYWRSWSSEGGFDTVGKLGVAPDAAYAPPALLALHLHDGGTVPCICGLTVRRAVALEVGGFDERIDNLFEDQVLIAKICAGHDVFVDGVPGERYRQHAASTSHQAVANGVYHPRRPNPSHHDYLSWLEAYLDSAGRRSPELTVPLTRAFWPYDYPGLYGVYDRFRRLRRRIGRIVSNMPARRSAPFRDVRLHRNPPA